MSGAASEMGYAIAFSPDGQRIATLDTAQVMVWDATNGQRLLSFPGKSIGQTINRSVSVPMGSVGCGEHGRRPQSVGPRHAD